MEREFENQVCCHWRLTWDCRAVVERFADRGAKVFFTYHQQEEQAREVAAVCGAVAMQCSQTEPAAIEAAVQRVVTEGGRLTCSSITPA